MNLNGLMKSKSSYVKRHWQELLMATIFLALYVLFTVNNWINGDVPPYILGVQGVKPDIFVLPLFFVVGTFFYWIAGWFIFVILPLALFAASYLILIKAFKEFGFNKLLILVCFLIALKFVQFAWYFTRESLFIFLGCFYAYYFFRSYRKNEDKYKELILITVLLSLTKVFGLVFILLTALLYLNKKKLLFMPLILFYSEHVLTTIKSVFDYAEKFKEIILFAFPNPFYCVSALVLIRRFNTLHFLVVLISIVSAVYIQLLGYPTGLTYRYTYVLFPLHLLFFADAFKRDKEFALFYTLILIMPLFHSLDTIISLVRAF